MVSRAGLGSSKKIFGQKKNLGKKNFVEKNIFWLKNIVGHARAHARTP